MRKLILLIAGAVALSQCSSKKAIESATIRDEDYVAFSMRFDTDSVFRKSRVKYKFDSRVDLRISRIDTTQFKISTHYNDSVTVSIDYLKDTSYWIKLIFKKEEGRWYLVNYLDSYDD